MGGRIPVFVVNRNLHRPLADDKIMREMFQRDDEIDKVERDELAGAIEQEQVYEEEEEAFIERVEDKLGGLKEEDFKELDSPDHLVKMHVVFKAKASTAIGRASTVRPPPPSTSHPSTYSLFAHRSSTRPSRRWPRGRCPR
jgi:hypothetical protein